MMGHNNMHFNLTSECSGNDAKTMHVCVQVKEKK